MLENRRLLAALPYGATEADLGEFMLGNVVVTPVFLESNGSFDPSTENWTSQHIQDVLANIETGLDWWVETLATQSTIHKLNFTVDTTFAVTPAETRYEPISRRSNDYTLYVNEFLQNQGATSGNIEAEIRSFNQSQREKYSADWSFTMFVVPSENDVDGQFAAGGSFTRAFSFAGGLFMIVPSTRPASTFTHETGHIFWARDEYVGGGSYFSRRGYYNTQNENAADNPTSGFVQQPSIMASGSLLDSAYLNHISPASTLAMIGWQDSDGDGIFDLMDVPHRLTGAGYFDSATGNYRFTGQAEVQTLPNLNSSGARNDITLNRIREIEYRFDGGPWQLQSSPDAYSVDLDLSIAVPNGVTQIEIRARDSETTVESNVFVGRLTQADATPVPGINGFVWIDANENGLRDIDELGQAGWQVDLVNGAGTPITLQTTIEPDNYAVGPLGGLSSSGIVLTAVGSDADGRVGVFQDSGASTGTKIFAPFSKGVQSFVSTWNFNSRRLQADFVSPTSVVQIDAIGVGTRTVGRLEAYNSSGQLLGRYTTGNLAANEVEVMTIERGQADIAYVIVAGHDNTEVKLDQLRFGAGTQTTTGDLGQYSFAALPPGNYTVKVSPPGGYTAIEPVGASQPASVTANTATVDVDFGFQVLISPWQNPRDVNDVNDDMLISALDVLLIVNEINANGSRDLRGSGLSTPPYVDVSGDNTVSALDVLRVINFINAHGSGSGEGEDSSFMDAGAWMTGSGNQPQPSWNTVEGEGEDDLLWLLAADRPVVD